MIRDSDSVRTLFMGGHAHIDPVWLWHKAEGLEEIRATFRSAADLMDEIEDLRFTADSAAFYAWIEAVDPVLCRRIQQRVREGRWELAGGWWVEPDCNLPGGESFARHALIAQRFFASRFDRVARIGSNPDSFGHSIGLPQLLRRAGIEGYVFARPGPDEKTLPGGCFRWRSPDGSEVLAARIPHDYCGPPGELDDHIRAAIAALPSGWNAAFCFYGVGDHEGGPTRANIASIRRLDARDGAARLELGTLECFFETMDLSAGVDGRSLPVIDEDLQRHAVGCYSALSAKKRWNRQAEIRLTVAETSALVAARLGLRAYPLAEFDRAWKDVLFNQFHDILGGTSIETAYDEVRDELGEAMAIAGRATRLATQAIAGLIDPLFHEGQQSCQRWVICPAASLGPAGRSVSRS